MALSAMVLCPMHGTNKVPLRALWWKEQDVLEKQVFDLAMELLCRRARSFSIGHRTDLQNRRGIAWQREGAFVVWQQTWLLWIDEAEKPEFIRRTYDINPVFAASALDGAYAADLCRTVYLDRMD